MPHATKEGKEMSGSEYLRKNYDQQICKQLSSLVYNTFYTIKYLHGHT